MTFTILDDTPQRPTGGFNFKVELEPEDVEYTAVYFDLAAELESAIDDAGQPKTLRALAEDFRDLAQVAEARADELEGAFLGMVEIMRGTWVNAAEVAAVYTDEYGSIQVEMTHGKRWPAKAPARIEGESPEDACERLARAIAYARNRASAPVEWRHTMPYTRTLAAARAPQKPE